MTTDAIQFTIVPMHISNRYTCHDVLQMRKISLPADNSCTCQPFTANARKDISEALIRHETEIVPAILSNPFNFVRTVMSIFKRHTKKKSIVTARNTTLHKVLQISNEYTYDDVSKIQKINLPADISCTCKPFTANARRDISKLHKSHSIQINANLQSFPCKYPTDTHVMIYCRCER